MYMNLSKRFFVGLAGLGLAASVAVPVFAATPSTGTNFQDPQQTLMQALIKRFNLNETDLTTFFNEQRTQHDVQATARVTERLTAQVTAGKLTEAQKTAITAKIAEAKAKHEEARKLTPEECRKMMDAYRTELEAWVKAQGLDRSYVPLIMGNPGGPRGGHGMMKGQNQNGTSQTGAVNGVNGQMGFGRRGGRGMFGGPMMNGQNAQGQQGMGQSGQF